MRRGVYYRKSNTTEQLQRRYADNMELNKELAGMESQIRGGGSSSRSHSHNDDDMHSDMAVKKNTVLRTRKRAPEKTSILPERVIEYEIICGMAGVGKTQMLAEYILQQEPRSFRVLSSTHSALNNLYTRCLSLLQQRNDDLYLEKADFRTIHSYFKIDTDMSGVKTGVKFDPLQTTSNDGILFIDEFGLVEKRIFKKCLNRLKYSNHVQKVVLCGDVMQLKGITIEKQLISFRKLHEYNTKWCLFMKDKNLNEKTVVYEGIGEDSGEDSNAVVERSGIPVNGSNRMAIVDDNAVFDNLLTDMFGDDVVVGHGTDTGETRDITGITGIDGVDGVVDVPVIDMFADDVSAEPDTDNTIDETIADMFADDDISDDASADRVMDITVDEPITTSATTTSPAPSPTLLNNSFAIANILNDMFKQNGEITTTDTSSGVPVTNTAVDVSGLFCDSSTSTYINVTNAPSASLLKLRNILNTYSTLDTVYTWNLSPEVIEHINSSIISSKLLSDAKRTMLTVNKRSKNHILQLINAIYSRDYNYPYEFVSYSEIKHLVKYKNYVCICAKYQILNDLCNNINDETNVIEIDTTIENMSLYEPVMQEFNDIVQAGTVKPPAVKLIMAKHVRNPFDEIMLKYGETYYCTINEPNHSFLNGDELIFRGFNLDAVPIDIEINADAMNNNGNRYLKIGYKYSLKFINKFTEKVVYIPLSHISIKYHYSSDGNKQDNDDENKQDSKYVIDIFNTEIINEKTTDTVRANIMRTGYYPIAPYNLITFHRSQGKSIENVIICIDDIFDLGMLYTGITRAVENVKFYTKYDTLLKNKQERCELLFCTANISAFLQMKLMLERVMFNSNDSEKNKRKKPGRAFQQYKSRIVNQ